jgi:hypothetical protein
MDAMQRLIELDAVARLRAHDATLFGGGSADIELASASLGWTDLAERGGSVLPELHRLAALAADEGVTDVVLLGMGGSSLASLVLSSVLGESGDATLHVLDTTAPRTVDAALASLSPTASTRSSEKLPTRRSAATKPVSASSRSPTPAPRWRRWQLPTAFARSWLRRRRSAVGSRRCRSLGSCRPPSPA